MSEGNPEREGQESTEEQEEQTKQPAPEAPPEEDVGTPPPPDDEEIRKGVQEGTDEAILCAPLPGGRERERGQKPALSRAGRIPLQARP